MNKITLTIDGVKVRVDTGSTILSAARTAGIDIPTMCYRDGFQPSTSCMLCVVKIKGKDSLVPSCAAPAEDGMEIETQTEEIQTARQTALELLLSDHLGDCMGPCQVACPASMNIPLMIRQIAAGKLDDAIRTVKKDIALPAVLGRICPAPCEKVCRRTEHDQPVSICLLKRYVADIDLFSQKPFVPDCQTPLDKKVAIVGAGPAGLSCAYYLSQKGYNCTIFDKNPAPGGMLRYGIDRKELPEDILNKEVDLILALGVHFKGNIEIGPDISIQQLQKDYEAVFLAPGQLNEQQILNLGFHSETQLKSTVAPYTTEVQGVFAGGDIIRKRKLAIRSLADGKEAAESIAQFLSGAEITGPAKSFNCRMGKLKEGEIEIFLQPASSHNRISPADDMKGYDEKEAFREARRCLRCDCRKAENCRLRDYSMQYQASLSRYKDQRRRFVRKAEHPEVIYEPGKCIDCGLCIRTTNAEGEKLGLTFIGRGFNVKVAVPFDESVAEGLKKTAAKCVEVCPTGALAFKDNIKNR